MNNDKLIQILSCFKGPFSLDWLLELTDWKATALLGRLNDAIQQGLLVESHSGIYHFTEASVRAGIEQGLAEDDRRANHQRIIDLLQTDPWDDPLKLKELSQHLLTVRNDLDASRCLAGAGDLYNKAADYPMAIKCYTRVIEDLRDNLDSDACLLYIETVNTFLNMVAARKDSDWAAEVIDEALKRAEAIRHQPFQALLKMHKAVNQWQRREYQAAMEIFEEAWQMTQAVEDPRFLKPITTISAFMAYWQGRVRRTVEIFEHSLQDVDTFPSGTFPLYASTTVAHSYALIGQVSHGLGMLDAIYSHAVKIGRYNIAGYAVYGIGQIMLSIGRLDEVHQSLLSLNEQDLLKYEERLRSEILLFKSFVLYLSDDIESSTGEMKRYLDLMESAGILPGSYIYLLYICWEVEEGRYPALEGLSLKTCLNAAIDSEQLIDKGVGYRFRALLMKKSGEPVEAVSDCLDLSLKWLTEAGLELETARTQIERAYHFLARDREVDAARTARIAADIFDKYSELEFPDDLKFLVSVTKKRENLLEEILKLGQDVVTIRGKRELAKYIISTVTRVTGAERGAIFLVTPGSHPPEFTFRAAKNLTMEDIEQPEFEPLMAIVREVASSSQGIIRKVAIEEGASYPSFGKVRSCICVPMLVQDRIVGVLYNDNRFLSSAFRESDLSTFTYFAALTAIAMDNAQAWDEIQRLNRKLGEEKRYYREQHLDSMQYDNFVGKSRVTLNMLGKVRQVAEADTTVLILGETGVGKELVSGIILDNSHRRDKPFICVNCSAFPETLIASELFGHEKGAFTGANERRIGRFELADGGTLFLDEIGDIPMEVQVRLLRVLQTREFERVGGTKTLSSDFRLIAATNQDLEALVKDGRFREDLYYRLNVFPIKVPPLRRRPDDIPLLALFFLRKFALKTGKPFTRISEADMAVLQGYSWPGNVRELENVMERAVVMSQPDHFRIPSLKADDTLAAGIDGGMTMAAVERRHIIWALNRTNWKIRGPGGAAELLGMHYSTLRSRIKKHDIKKQLTVVS